MKNLERNLGLWSVIAISISAMLGSGIFVLPGLAFAKTGPSVWMAYLGAAVCVLPAALSKAELATAMPTSGGTYVYIDRTFGPLAGTIAGLALWLSLLLKSAFALIGFGTYLEVVAGHLPLKAVALALLAGILLLNIFGAKKVGKVQLYSVGISIGCLFLLFLFGIPKMSLERLSDPFEHGLSGYIAAMAFVFVSFAGVTKVAAVAEEVSEPERNLPRGILLSLVIVATIYAVIVLTMAAILPHEALKTDLHPVWTLARAVAGPGPALVVASIAILTMTAMSNSGLLAASRFPFAMGREKLLPKALGRVHPRFLTPILSILLTGAVMAIAILFLDVEKLAKLASAAMIFLYSAENLVVIVLRESGVQWYRPSFRSPFFPAIQIFGILSGLGLLLMLGLSGIFVLVGCSLGGLVLFWTYGRNRVDRRGVVGRMGRRLDLLLEGGEEDDGFQASWVEEAEVIIGLYGQERSPEMLAEVGTTLCPDLPAHVVHFTAIPEQSSLEAALIQAPLVRSLKRRLIAMAEEEGVEIRFHAVVTRDVLATLHRISTSSASRWIVLGWKDFRLYNPFGWLVNHLSCNLALFRDTGVRYIRKILVLAEPGPNDALVVHTADHLADLFKAELVFIALVPPDAPAPLVQSKVDYVDQCRHLCRSQSEILVLRGKRGEKVIPPITDDFDLLVTGMTALSPLHSLFLPSDKDRLCARSKCSVLLLKTPRTLVSKTYSKRAGIPGGVSAADRPPLNERTVRLDLEIDSKEEAFSRIAGTFAAALDRKTEIVEVTRTIETALWERERSQNTAVGMGLAMPHATVDDLERTYLGVFRLKKPIDYQAPDGGRVDVLFVTVGPPSDRQTHLFLLASLSRKVLREGLLEEIRGASAAEEVVTLLASPPEGGAEEAS